MKAIFSAAVAAFAADQASKWWILEGLNLDELLRFDVLPPFLNFRMAWNYGVNFGLGAGVGAWALVALSVAISAALLWWSRTFEDLPRRIGVGLIVGGALGNALDRVIHGAVVDFLNMSCCGINNPYAFNLADVFIFAGVGALIFLEPKKAN